MQVHPLASVQNWRQRGNAPSSWFSRRGSARKVVPSVQPEDFGHFKGMRVALVHDFLYVYAGAERVLEQLIAIFPNCDLFALFDYLPEGKREFLQGKQVITSRLQNLPFVRTHHRAYLPLMPVAIEQLNLSAYDLVISSSYLVAKGILKGPDQLHICYCHTPARYAWDLQHAYLDRAGLGFGLRGLVARRILHKFRIWDVCRTPTVDHFIANSQFVARRIYNCYRRDATVIHAPVDVDFYQPSSVPREDYYLVAGRIVPYKRTDLVVEAFGRRPDLKLKIIGTGPDFDRVRRLAGPNVELLGYQDDATLRHHYHRAKALVFAAEEDFGIVPVEAMACGTPVIAFGKGGVTESVTPGVHGVMFDRQDVESLLEAVDRFESMNSRGELMSATICHNAGRFSRKRFLDEMTSTIAGWVDQRWPPQETRLYGSSLGRDSPIPLLNSSSVRTSAMVPRSHPFGRLNGQTRHSKGHGGAAT